MTAVPLTAESMEKEQVKWTKQPAVQGTFGGCLNCGPRPDFFPGDGVIAVGFGYAALHRDGEPVWTEDMSDDGGDFMTGARAEELAADDPDHDWQIVLEGPLSGRTYQRHGPNEWVLIAQNLGFA
jgi:hypothetical protein